MFFKIMPAEYLLYYLIKCIIYIFLSAFVMMIQVSSGLLPEGFFEHFVNVCQGRVWAKYWKSTLAEERDAMRCQAAGSSDLQRGVPGTGCKGNVRSYS